ncbi:MAG: glutamate racemase, partial [Clostridium sp.]
GCTHYPFIKDTLAKVVGSDVKIVDGSLGTVKELRRRLLEKDLLTDNEVSGKIEIFNSSENRKLIDISNELIRI